MVSNKTIFESIKHQTGYGAEQRRFSCPVSSDKGCQLTFFYRGIYLVEQRVFFVTYGKML